MLINRDSVPFSIIKCKTAGIKVIMVTGDQPVTAAAIARTVNIIDSNMKTNIDLEEELGLGKEEAIMRAEAIIIHGDQITEASKEDEMLSEGIIFNFEIFIHVLIAEKGRKLAYWLSKKHIVFARTSPAQKLIIVKGCQAINEIVAVTGDGVNDSPAIKKADIGISMGITGSDVAKDAADLILLTDDFASLIVGIEEGRKLFDNLKKTISYSLTANIPEAVPFILLILGKIPLPVTTILLLCISVGTDMFPAISLAYEEAELDIMIRKPRDRHERLVSKKLLTFVYLQMGVFEAFASFLMYFIIMNDFGFPFSSLFGLALKKAYIPNSSDIYDSNDPYFGNSRLRGVCDNGHNLFGSEPYTNNYRIPDWIFSKDLDIDLRMAYVDCALNSNRIPTGGLTHTIKFSACNVHQISSITGKPICYSIEAIKYTQTAFFIAIVWAQIGCLTANKARRTSIFYNGFKNFFQLWGIIAELIFCMILAYIPVLNTVLGTRDVRFLHFGLGGLPFALFILIYDEIRKLLISNSLKNVKEGEKPGWWYRNYNC